ncbi:MAG: BspA family leucine-rich repeat surface protein, partial [Prevotella sp.]|nr:BspA family leucine-rich repeat surface protein [Prevotella sp.]
MKRLFLILITMLLPLCGWAEKQGYAVFNKSKGTLTFKYGEKPEGDNVYDTDNTSIYRVEWELTFEYVTKVVFESSFAKARPTSTAHWFSTMPYIGYMVSPLKEIVGLKYLNTSQVTNMANMFLGCNKLTSLDVSHFDTSKVTDMSNMFSGCAGLKSLDLSNFNTSKVESFGNMFERCSSLSSLNVSSFNTSKSTHMGGMFIYCSSLKKLDVRNFNTSKVTDMSYMFCGCTGLTSLDLSNFNTSKVDNMYSMFLSSNNLTELDL